jgi:hypothetical protein
VSTVFVTGVATGIFLLASAPLHAAILSVPSGGDLQAALNAARPGDEVVLASDARFVGMFVLPVKAAGAPIVVRSSATLPERRLVWPQDGPLLPTIASGSVIAAFDGTNAANWILRGLRFEGNAFGAGNVIQLQNASNIVMDRIIIVAGAQGQKRAIMGNGRNITLTRSHIANIWASGQDSQAFCAWDGAGPYTITDNYLEAASENVMFGGANSSSPANVPADILVENNHLSKPLEWRGVPRTVKNLFELKSAKRVIVRNNLFERNWTDAQNGYSILFTVRNDEGGAPWSVVEDVLFERNVVRDVENGINVLGYDSYQPSGRATRITIRNNLIITSGTFLQAGSEVGVLTVDHNTVDQRYTFMMLYGGAVWLAGTSAARLAQFAVENLTVTNMLANHNEYGLMGEDAGMGTPALLRQTRSYTWTNNVLAGGNLSIQYPATTWRPTVAEYQAQFSGGYNLSTSSSYISSGTNGSALGSQSGLEPRAPGNLRMVGSH